MQKTAVLLKRGVLRLTGKDRKSFLQGLITNDIQLLGPFHSLYSAFLSPQGRFLHDFFLVEEEEALFIETQKDQAEALKKRLNLYKLRAQVILEDVSDDYAVFAMLNHKSGAEGQTQLWQGGMLFVDPRLSSLGSRWIVPRKNLPDAFLYQEDDREYDLFRLQFGIPEAGKDIIPDRSIPLETGLQDLNAISWSKGCYLGQELTARTKYRGEIRKRLLPVEIASPSFDAAQPVRDEKGEKVGELYSFCETRGIARLRLEKLDSPLFIDSMPVKVHRPSWVKL